MSHSFIKVRKVTVGQRDRMRALGEGVGYCELGRI